MLLFRILPSPNRWSRCLRRKTTWQFQPRRVPLVSVTGLYLSVCSFFLFTDLKASLKAKHLKTTGGKQLLQKRLDNPHVSDLTSVPNLSWAPQQERPGLLFLMKGKAKPQLFKTDGGDVVYVRTTRQPSAASRVFFADSIDQAVVKKRKASSAVDEISVPKKPLTSARDSVDLVTRLAFVIGNANYSGMAKLPSCVVDVDKVKAKLEALGYTVVNEKTKDVSAADLSQSLMTFGVKAVQARKSNTVVKAIVYFSGHGSDGTNSNKTVGLFGVDGVVSEYIKVI